MVLLGDGFCVKRSLLKFGRLGVTPKRWIRENSRAQEHTSSLHYILHSLCHSRHGHSDCSSETAPECKLAGGSLRISNHMACEKLFSSLIGRYHKRNTNLDRICDLEGNTVPASSLIVAKY